MEFRMTDVNTTPPNSPSWCFPVSLPADCVTLGEKTTAIKRETPNALSTSVVRKPFFYACGRAQLALKREWLKEGSLNTNRRLCSAHVF